METRLSKKRKLDAETKTNRILASCSSIEKIPKELKWKVLEYVPEAILSLRQTSFTMKEDLDEYVRKPTIQLISGVDIFDKHQEWQVWIIMPENKVKMYFLRQKLEINQPKISDYIGLRSNLVVYDFPMKSRNTRCIEYIRRCMGQEIEYLKTYTSLANDIVRKLMNGINYNQMHYSAERLITEDEGERIISNIRMHGVEQLTIAAEKLIMPNPVAFLIKLSNMVRSLGLKQICVGIIPQNEKFFMGISDVDWAPIILDMMSRKTNKLNIINDYYRKYLSPTSAEIIAKKLPLLGKKIWFDAVCEDYRCDQRNADHIVYGNGEQLSIKHYSRKDEGYDFK